MSLYLFLALAAVFLGTALQRVTGIGIALVCSPLLVLLLGPFHGVFVANVASTLAAAILFIQLRGNVQWRRFSMLLPGVLLGVILGAWLAVHLSTAILDIIVGAAVLLGLTGSFLVSRLAPSSSLPTTMTFGFVSGVMNVTAGVGGPALSMYSVISRWQQASFAATVQPVFAIMGATSVLSKLVGTGRAELELTLWNWTAVVVAVGLGAIAGTVAARHVSSSTARAAVILLAYTGATATLLRGILAIL